MYLEIDEKLKDKIEKITSTDYDFKDNFLPSESITSIFEDLIYEIDRLEEKYEDLEQDMEDNYIKRPMSDYTGDKYDDRF
ncbi:MAG: hypothetical protein ACI4VQ_01355 [Clostridia bacterium]